MTNKGMTIGEAALIAKKFFGNMPLRKTNCWLVSPCHKFLLNVSPTPEEKPKEKRIINISVYAKSDFLDVKEVWKINLSDFKITVEVSVEIEMLSSVSEGNGLVNGSTTWHPEDKADSGKDFIINDLVLWPAAYHLMKLIEKSEPIFGLKSGDGAEKALDSLTHFASIK